MFRLFSSFGVNQFSFIDLLSAKKEVGGQVQALHELGNLYLHQENYREANRVWCQAIDILFKSNDVISDWRKVTKSRFGDKEVGLLMLLYEFMRSFQKLIHIVFWHKIVSIPWICQFQYQNELAKCFDENPTLPRILIFPYRAWHLEMFDEVLQNFIN